MSKLIVDRNIGQKYENAGKNIFENEFLIRLNSRNGLIGKFEKYLKPSNERNRWRL